MISDSEERRKVKTHVTLEALHALDVRMQQLQALGPLAPKTRQSLAEALRTHITYASNAIEGNHLTLAETQVVLQGLTVGGRPLRDHLEALDHAEAWDALVSWSQNSEPLTPWVLRNLHHLVLQRSQPDEAGQYRRVPVAISGSTLVPPDPVAVPSAVDDLMAGWSQDPEHPVVSGARVHARLMAIHPFADGNGRAGRLLLNLWLLRHHYVPMILEPEDRAMYYAALQDADAGNFQPIVHAVIQGISHTLGIYEAVLHPSPSPTFPRSPHV